MRYVSAHWCLCQIASARALVRLLKIALGLLSGVGDGSAGATTVNLAVAGVRSVLLSNSCGVGKPVLVAPRILLGYAYKKLLLRLHPAVFRVSYLMDPIHSAALLAGCCTVAGCGCAAVNPEVLTTTCHSTALNSERSGYSQEQVSWQHRFFDRRHRRRSAIGVPVLLQLLSRLFGCTDLTQLEAPVESADTKAPHGPLLYQPTEAPLNSLLTTTRTFSPDKMSKNGSLENAQTMMLCSTAQASDSDACRGSWFSGSVSSSATSQLLSPHICPKPQPLGAVTVRSENGCDTVDALRSGCTTHQPSKCGVHDLTSPQLHAATDNHCRPKDGDKYGTMLSSRSNAASRFLPTPKSPTVHRWKTTTAATETDKITGVSVRRLSGAVLGHLLADYPWEAAATEFTPSNEEQQKRQERWKADTKNQGQWRHAASFFDDLTSRLHTRQHTSPAALPYTNGRSVTAPIAFRSDASFKNTSPNPFESVPEPPSAFFIRRAYAQSLTEEQKRRETGTDSPHQVAAMSSLLTAS